MGDGIYLDILDQDRQQVFRKLYELVGKEYYLAGLQIFLRKRLKSSNIFRNVLI